MASQSMCYTLYRGDLVVPKAMEEDATGPVLCLRVWLQWNNGRLLDLPLCALCPVLEQDPWAALSRPEKNCVKGCLMQHETCNRDRSKVIEPVVINTIQWNISVIRLIGINHKCKMATFNSYINKNKGWSKIYHCDSSMRYNGEVVLTSKFW